MPPPLALRTVMARARRQADVLTTAQLVSQGVLASWVTYQVRVGRWQRVHHGVVVTHSGPISWRSRAWAALLYAGHGAVLSHETAARLWSFTRHEPDRVDVSIPGHRRVRPTAGVVVHVRSTMPDATGGLRTTTRAETAVDLVSAARTVDDAVGWIAQAVRAGAQPEIVLAAARARTRFRHRGLVLDLLDTGDLTIESPMEHRYERDVERAHGLPRGTSQARHRVGGHWIRADRWYAESGVRVELDRRWVHAGTRVDADVWRDVAVALERWELTLRYRWSHVAARPCVTAMQVAEALRSRGWQGRPRPCSPTCPVRLGVA